MQTFHQVVGALSERMSLPAFLNPNTIREAWCRIVRTSSLNSLPQFPLIYVANKHCLRNIAFDFIRFFDIKIYLLSYFVYLFYRTFALL